MIFQPHLIVCVYIYIVYAAVISIWICWIGLIVSISFQSATLNTIKNRPYGTPSMNRSVLHQGLLGGIQNIYRGKDSSDCLPETLAASDRQGPAPAPRGFVREGPGGDLATRNAPWRGQLLDQSISSTWRKLPRRAIVARVLDQYWEVCEMLTKWGGWELKTWGVQLGLKWLIQALDSATQRQLPSLVI